MDDGQRLKFVNAEFAAMHGYTPVELEGLPLEILFTKSERRNVEAFDRKVEAQGTVTLREEHVKKDGGLLQVIKQITVVKDESDRLLNRTVTLIDATHVQTWRELIDAPEQSKVSKNE